MLNWPGILASTGAIVPAGLVLFVSYGRYDGCFRDNVVFLNFIGGLLVGLFGGVFLLFVGSGVVAADAAGAPRVSAPSEIVFIATFALLVPVLVTAIVNRRKWQGERHAVFNGGALGAGAGATTTLLLWRDRVPEVAFLPLLDLLLWGTALTLVFTVAGFIVGAAVLDRRPFRGLALAAVVAAPVGFFLIESFVARALGGGAWVWILLALAFGAAVYAWAATRLLPRGVSEEDRRRVRRFRRRRDLAP